MSGEKPHEETPELLAAKRCGDPYIVYADARDRQRVLSLPDNWDRVTIDRGMGADVALTWDPGVSRVHAELARLADDWTVVDDGLSRKGPSSTASASRAVAASSTATFCAAARPTSHSTHRSSPPTRRGPPTRLNEPRSGRPRKSTRN